ncbi:trifunctional histidinol dehydrogenase [Irineochytrium annulatum]|nr:trifunctional histidinol dehydrogenase [Irineochytrium annulatum]
MIVVASEELGKVKTFGLVADVLVSLDASTKCQAAFDSTTCWIEMPLMQDKDVTRAIQVLDSGASKIVISPPPNALGGNAAISEYQSFAESVLPSIPGDRVIIRLPALAEKPLLDVVSLLNPNVGGFILKLNFDISVIDTDSDPDANTPRKTFERQQAQNLLKQIAVALGQDGYRRRLIIDTSTIVPSYSLISKLDKQNVDVLLDRSVFGDGETKTAGKLDIAEAVAACLVTDRADGLYPTMVVDEQRVALGLAYTSVKSLAETIRTGQGVYQSRSRGLWYKGLSSGATQTIKRIGIDCDKDTLQYVVDQKDPGYCHQNTRTCFGHDSGITALASLLRSRKQSAPTGSYTRRLFENSALLHSKIIEEANELCEATTPEDIAWEAADLIYFALVKCAQAGVSMSDIERQLDRRSKKVTRRPGDAKPEWTKSENGSSGEKKKAEPERKDPSPQAPADAPATTDAADASSSMKMKIIVASSLSKSEHAALLRRPAIKSEEILSRVKPIINDVANRGDTALIEFTKKFDGVELASTVLKAPFDGDLMAISEESKRAIDEAYENIFKFHDAQLERAPLIVETMPGVVCSRFCRPIERVGLYVPGGTAVLPSTALMLGVPAKVAGCTEIVIASPPRKDGTPVPEIVYVAAKIGAAAIVMAGGAQAVAAMAHGTESVPKVDKICGPGNQYVTAAKMLLQNDASAMISIDMPAGPSEVLVIADKSCNPAYVVSDLLSQAEHGGDSQVVLVAVAMDAAKLQAIEREIQEQGSALPRAAIVRTSLNASFILQVETVEEAYAFSNSYCPEHLILHIENAPETLSLVKNAGSVFVGQWSPESCGDYASGTNHTLPTYGYARMYSGVSTATFVKYITSQNLSKDGLRGIGNTVMKLAEIEGLEAHRNAVALRMKDI